MRKEVQKLIIFIIVIGLIFPSINSILSLPKVYAAAMPVTDPVHTKVTIGQAVKDVANWAKNFYEKNLGKWVKLAFSAFKKRVLDMLTTDMIAWINGGGKPKWLSGDWSEVSENAFQAAVGDVALQTSLGFLCSPINFQVQLALIAAKPYRETITCTLDKITGNIENFYKDFKRGGWLAYHEIWQPQNNFYAATLMALDEAERKGYSAAAGKKDEVIAGQGFLSTKKCTYEVDFRGTFIDKKGTRATPQDVELAHQGKKPLYSRTCETVTPGSFIGAQTAKAFGIFPDWLVSTDEIAPYLVAIADAAINRLIKKGADGLIGMLSKDPTTPVSTPTSPCAGLTGEALKSCFGYGKVVESSFKSDKDTILAQINNTLEPRKKAANLLQEAIDSQLELVTVLENLNCDSSQDARNRLDELQAKFDDNATFLEPLEQAVSDIGQLESSEISEIAIQSASIQSLIDDLAANEVLTDAQTERDSIIPSADEKRQLIEQQNTCL
jgi:hypothetical protein